MRLVGGAALFSVLLSAGCEPLPALLRCADDGDCERGHHCTAAGSCERAAPRPDAGGPDDDDGGPLPDAGAGADAGPLPVDGGEALDAGFDAGLDAGPAGPPDLAPWWDGAWGARRRLRFHTADVGLPLTGFPVMVRLADFVDLARVHGDGADLRFIDADESVLAYEIARWGVDPIAYVKVPRVERLRSDDHIFVYYDNPNASSAADAAAVWSDYVSVLHFESYDGSSTPDSTAQGNDGSVSGATLTGGKVGSALALTASSGNLEIEELANSGFPQGASTVELWFTSEPTAEVIHLFDVPDQARAHLALYVGTDASGNRIVVADAQTGTGGKYTEAAFDGAELASYAAVTYRPEPTDDTNLDVNRDDARGYEVWEDPFTPSQQRAVLGANLVGTIDEVRVSSVARDHHWRQASVLSESDTFLIADLPWPPPDVPPHPTARVPGAVLLYDFDDAFDVTVEDTGTGVALPLTVHAEGVVTPLAGGVRLVEAARLHSDPDPQKVMLACADGAFSVEVWLMLDSPLANGPTRILTLTESPTSGTFAVVQQLAGGDRSAPRLAFRLRTTQTNPSGALHETQGPALAIDEQHLRFDRPMHVVFTWSAGMMLGYVDGFQRASKPWPGSCLTDPGERVVIGNEYVGGRAFLGAVYLAAVYDDALTPTEVLQNFNAGP